MKLLRPLAGYTLQDHKTNDFICSELKITAILYDIDEYRLNWNLHLQRMPQNRIPLKSYHCRPQGRRTTGRPKKRWREQLQLWRRNGSNWSNPWGIWWWLLLMKLYYLTQWDDNKLHHNSSSLQLTMKGCKSFRSQSLYLYHPHPNINLLTMKLQGYQNMFFVKLRTANFLATVTSRRSHVAKTIKLKKK